MAVLTHTAQGVATSTTNDTTLVLTTLAPIAIGATFWLSVVANSASATATAVDASANPGMANVYALDGLVRGAATSEYLFRTNVTRSIPSGAPIATVTFSVAVTRKALSAFSVTGWLVPVALERSASAVAATNPLTLGPTAATSVPDSLVVASYGVNTSNAAASYTTPAGYTAGAPAVATAAGTIRVARYWWLETAAAAAQSHASTASSGLVQWVGFLATYKAANAGTLFTKSISGGLTFAGSAPKKAVGHRVTAAVFTPVGTRTSSPKGRLVTGSFAPAGSVSKQQSLVRTLVGAVLAPVGGLSRLTSRSLVGAVFHPTGVRSAIKSVSQAVSGALSFSGSRSALPAKSVSGSYAPTGSLSRVGTFARLLSAASFTPTGVMGPRAINHKLSGALSFVGIVASSSRGALTAIFRPTGVATHGVQQRTLFASLSFTTSLPRQVTRFLFASLIASAVIHTRYIPPPGVSPPGGGGFGALMADSHFQRYQVAKAWRHMKRVKP